MYVKIYTHNASMNFNCDLCSENYQEDMVSAALLLDGADNPKDGLDVCPKCLAAGPGGTAQRIKEYAEKLRAKAKKLDDLAGEVETIALNAWKTPDDLGAARRRLHAVMRIEDALYELRAVLTGEGNPAEEDILF